MRALRASRTKLRSSDIPERYSRDDVKQVGIKRPKQERGTMDRKQVIIILAAFLLLATEMFIGCSEKELSAAKAEKILTETEKETLQITVHNLGNSLKKDAANAKEVTRYYNYFGDYEIRHKNNELGDGFTKSPVMWQELENKGLIKYKMTEKRVPNDGGDFLGNDARRYLGKTDCPSGRKCWFYDAFQIRFTSDAEKYVTVERMPAVVSGPNQVVQTTVKVTSALFDKVEVKRMNTAPGKGGEDIIYVDYVVHYKPTPFGDVYLKQEELQKEKGAIFKRYENGWRIWK
jgi:hypothetical protein